MQLATGRISDEIFDEMVTEANRDLARMEKYKLELITQKESCEHEKEYLIDSIEMIEDILENNKLSNSDIVSLIDKIVIYDTDEIGVYGKNKVRVEIVWRM